MLQLQSLQAPPQGVGLFGERDVGRLQLLQQPLALVEPARRTKPTSYTLNVPVNPPESSSRVQGQRTIYPDIVVFLYMKLFSWYVGKQGAEQLRVLDLTMS